MDSRLNIKDTEGILACFDVLQEGYCCQTKVQVTARGRRSDVIKWRWKGDWKGFSRIMDSGFNIKDTEGILACFDVL